MPKPKKESTPTRISTAMNIDDGIRNEVTLTVATVSTVGAKKSKVIKSYNNFEVNPSTGSSQSLVQVNSAVTGKKMKTKKKTKLLKESSSGNLVSEGKSLKKQSSSKSLSKGKSLKKQSSSKILVSQGKSLKKKSSSKSIISQGKSLKKKSSSKSLVAQVKNQPSLKNLVKNLKGHSSSNNLLSLVKSQLSEERKLKKKKSPQEVRKNGESIDILPYENVNEPMEVSHESLLLSRNDKPVPPIIKDANRMDTSLYLARIQSYFDQLGYHREGEPKIRVNIRLSIKHLLETAKDLIKAGEPIKCLHALVLAVHFTNPCTIIERFPLHFKSKFRGREYKHVVLGVYTQGFFGALGISRDCGLQDKSPVYPRLSELINDYFKCYTDSGHELLEVKIGAIVTHDVHSLQNITWKLGMINFRTIPSHLEIEIERCSKKLRSQMGLACLRCVRPSPGAGGCDILYPSNPHKSKASMSLGGRRSEKIGKTRSVPVINKSKKK